MITRERGAVVAQPGARRKHIGIGAAALALLIIAGVAISSLTRTRTRPCERAPTPPCQPTPQPALPATWADSLADTNIVRVDDRVGLIPGADRMDLYLDNTRNVLNIDSRVLVVPAIDGGLAGYARQVMRDLGIGRQSGGRGLLYLYDAGSRRLRIEVGPGLEGIVTDHFAGYLMRDHMREWSADGNLDMGLRLTLWMVTARIRDAAMGRDYDPRAIDYLRDPQRLAAGAGASAQLPSQHNGTGFLNSMADSALAAYYVPQPDVEHAYQRWLEWLGSRRFAYDVTLFTPDTRAFLARLNMTRAYNDYMLYLTLGKRYQIVERDSLAMLYFTGTPFVSPHYFRRTADGWQMDVLAEVRNSKEWEFSAMTWTITDSDDDYSRAFRDLNVEIMQALRIRGGDNRPLPVR